MRRIRGTEDILPAQSARWLYVEDIARTLFNNYNYQEIRTPIFEAYELFQRSVGETSDIVSKEMYDFKDKGDRHLTLRPEGTAGVVRAYVEHKLYGPEYPKPYKMYYMGPMFRYERPQAGRQRQFHQIGVEAFGSDNPAVDVEVIALAMDFFHELGLSDLTLKINTLGKTDERKAYLDALVTYFEPLKDQLSEDSQRRLYENPLRILDSKDKTDQQLVQDAPTIHDFLGEESQAHFQTVREMLDALNIDFEIDATLVRGLDYYQDTIFEIMADDKAIGAQATVCGGGRYDGLAEDLNGPHTPSVGFGIGMERLLLLLDQQDIELDLEEELDVYVLTLGQEANLLSLQLTQAARDAGLNADRDYLDRGLRAQFRTADKEKAKVTMIIGENEVESGQISLKSQVTNKEETVTVDELLDDFYGAFQHLTVDTSVIDQFFKGE